MNDVPDSRAAANGTDGTDGTDGIMLAIAPVILAAMLLVTAAAFTGSEADAPAAGSAQAESTVAQN